MCLSAVWAGQSAMHIQTGAAWAIEGRMCVDGSIVVAKMGETVSL